MKCNIERRQIDTFLRSKTGRKQVLETCYDTLDKYEVLFIYALNRMGYGKTRLERIYKAMEDARVELSAYYCADEINDPNIDLYAMKKELEEKGISPDDLNAYAKGGKSESLN